MFATIDHDKLARPDEGTMSSCCIRPRSSRAGSTILLFSKRVDVLDRVPLPGWQVRGQPIHVPTASMLHSLSFAHRWREVDALNAAGRSIAWRERWLSSFSGNGHGRSGKRRSPSCYITYAAWLSSWRRHLAPQNACLPFPLESRSETRQRSNAPSRSVLRQQRYAILTLT
jgi:hypothetical protein